MYICCQNVSAMIENPPRLKQEHLVKAFKLLSDPIVKSFVEELNDSYYYWSDVKYKRPPIEIDPVQLWACVIMSRTLKKIDVWDKYGVSFSVSNKMQRLTGELATLFEQSHTLETEIKKQLESIGYKL